MKDLTFLGNVSGNLAASSFSSYKPMYSFRRACSDRIRTKAFSFVMFRVYGRPLRLGGRASGLSTLISESRMNAEDALNTLKIASLDSELLKHSSMT